MNRTMITRSDDRDLSPPEPSAREKWMPVTINLRVKTSILASDATADDVVWDEVDRVISALTSAGFDASYTDHELT